MASVPLFQGKTNNQRLYFLDWVRIFAFFLLIMYHVGMYYVTWDWSIKSPFSSDTLEPLMLLSNPWRLGLLFMVSGVASSFMLNKGSAGQFGWQRSLRLLIPLFFGMAVIVPPQPYLEATEKAGYAGSYVDFLYLYFHAYKGLCYQSGCIRMPTWSHLWFVVYIWAYSMVLGLLMGCTPRLVDKMREGLRTWMRGWSIVILPVVYLGLVRLILLNDFPQTFALLGDWFNHSTYLFLFLFGALIATVQCFWEELAKVRWRSLGLALAGWTFWYFSPKYFSNTQTIAIEVRIFREIVFVFLAWNAILAACGFAKQHLNFDHAARRYLALAVFPVYILHQTIIIMLAHAFKPLQMSPLLEGLLLLSITFVLSFVGFDLIRRVAILRPLFGLPWNLKQQ